MFAGILGLTVVALTGGLAWRQAVGMNAPDDSEQAMSIETFDFITVDGHTNVYLAKLNNRKPLLNVPAALATSIYQDAERHCTKETNKDCGIMIASGASSISPQEFLTQFSRDKAAAWTNYLKNGTIYASFTRKVGQSKMVVDCYRFESLPKLNRVRCLGAGRHDDTLYPTAETDEEARTFMRESITQALAEREKADAEREAKQRSTEDYEARADTEAAMRDYSRESE